MDYIIKIFKKFFTVNSVAIVILFSSVDISANPPKKSAADLEAIATKADTDAYTGLLSDKDYQTDKNYQKLWEALEPIAKEIYTISETRPSTSTSEVHEMLRHAVKTIGNFYYILVALKFYAPVHRGIIKSPEVKTAHYAKLSQDQLNEEVLKFYKLIFRLGIIKLFPEDETFAYTELSQGQLNEEVLKLYRLILDLDKEVHLKAYTNVIFTDIPNIVRHYANETIKEKIEYLKSQHLEDYLSVLKNTFFYMGSQQMLNIAECFYLKMQRSEKDDPACCYALTLDSSMQRKLFTNLTPFTRKWNIEERGLPPSDLLKMGIIVIDHYLYQFPYIFPHYTEKNNDPKQLQVILNRNEMQFGSFHEIIQQIQRKEKELQQRKDKKTEIAALCEQIASQPNNALSKLSDSIAQNQRLRQQSEELTKQIEEPDQPLDLSGLPTQQIDLPGMQAIAGQAHALEQSAKDLLSIITRDRTVAPTSSPVK